VSELLQHLQKVTADLDDAQARYALVGGMALTLRTEPRFTRDLDLAVAVDSDEQAETLARNLMQREYCVTLQTEHETKQRLATLRLAMPGGSSIVVDLLFASCGIEPEIVEQAERIEALPGWFVPVAQAEHLLAMKLLASEPTRRPQDLVDARALLATMTSDQLDRARKAVALIEQRGFNRKRDLLEALDRLVQEQQNSGANE